MRNSIRDAESNIISLEHEIQKIDDKLSSTLNEWRWHIKDWGCWIIAVGVLVWPLGLCALVLCGGAYVAVNVVSAIKKTKHRDAIANIHKE